MTTGINHLTLAVREVDRSLDFYVNLLNCHTEARWDHGAYLSLGSLWLCLSADKSKPTSDYTLRRRFLESGQPEDRNLLSCLPVSVRHTLCRIARTERRRTRCGVRHADLHHQKPAGVRCRTALALAARAASRACLLLSRCGHGTDRARRFAGIRAAHLNGWFQRCGSWERSMTAYCRVFRH